MKQSHNAIVSCALGLFVYTLLPNATAFFGSPSNYKSSRWSNSVSPKSGIYKRDILSNDYSQSCSALYAAPTLLADPMPNSIGNFFENKTDGMSFIQCYMLSVAVVDGLQYGTDRR